MTLNCIEFCNQWEQLMFKIIPTHKEGDKTDITKYRPQISDQNNKNVDAESEADAKRTGSYFLGSTCYMFLFP